MPHRCLIDFPHGQQPPIRGCFEKPIAVLEAWEQHEVISTLQQAEQYARQGRWAIGMVAYESAPAFDPAFQTHAAKAELPLAAFAVFDAPLPTAPSHQAESFSCSPWKNNITRAVFRNVIDRIHNHIAAGDYYQTNFTSRLTSDFKGDAEAFFQELVKAQPESYSFFLDFGAWQIASVSPELFFAWNPITRELVTRPMKGTSSLRESALDLKLSAKDQAENVMIVDLLRNDLSRIATNVHVPELFAVQTLPTLRQMTSTVCGTTRPDTKLTDVFQALFPCGSITGAPKVAAMKAIRALETTPRGAYCGALGVLQPGGHAVFSVGIRSITISENKAVCGIGSGITWDSKANEEYAEAQMKQRFLWRASAGFDLLETIRLENGQFWLLERHIERIKRSVEYFGFLFDETAVRDALVSCAKENQLGVFRLRLLVNRKGAVKTEIFPLESNPDCVTVALAARPIQSDDEFIRHKTTNRTVYEQFAPTDTGIFDTLLYNEHDEITEFTRGNVAVEFDGKLYTPPLESGLLAGTLRAEMLGSDKLTERIITRDDVKLATKVWFLNGLRGMIAVKLSQ